jgi:hypothetical protein
MSTFRVWRCVVGHRFSIFWYSQCSNSFDMQLRSPSYFQNNTWWILGAILAFVRNNPYLSDVYKFIWCQCVLSCRTQLLKHQLHESYVCMSLSMNLMFVGWYSFRIGLPPNRSSLRTSTHEIIGPRYDWPLWRELMIRIHQVNIHTALTYRDQLSETIICTKTPVDILKSKYTKPHLRAGAQNLFW